MTPIQSAMHTIDAVAAKTDTVMLMCSLGKDSLVTLDLIYPKFKRILCVFMYFVKGLEHIERWVRWCKARYPRIEFKQIPHWNLTYILRSGMYCVPQSKIKLLNLRDVIRGLRAKYGVEYCFLGMKKADGMNRLLMLKAMEEGGYEQNGMVYPLADWNQKMVLSYMRQHRLPAPVRYSLKASSGVGFNIDCLSWLQKNSPGDLRKIFEVFPLCERELWEYNQKTEKEADKIEMQSES